MKFDVLTLFPNMFEHVLGESMIGRAREKKLLDVSLINIRDFSLNKHKKVDDAPYGGGTGMVMAAQPIYDAWKSTFVEPERPFTIYLTPQGQVLNQKMAHDLLSKEHIVLICGHYEGVDERLIEEIVDLEISIGDYVLTGGEIAAMAVIDCVGRLVPGVLPTAEAYIEESHTNGLLEYPQYTRPEIFMGRAVPEVLLSGHHANIEEWRLEQSKSRTKLKRPDMLV
ncbi:MAG: tRNA (guanosine(37)-N1)-methyltransferase TrmD, partial [Clostridia bacterium]